MEVPYFQFIDRIQRAWEDKSLKMDWLGLENLLRDILYSRDLTEEDKISLCKATLAAYTKRGY